VNFLCRWSKRLRRSWRDRVEAIRSKIAKLEEPPPPPAWLAKELAREEWERKTEWPGRYPRSSDPYRGGYNGPNIAEIMAAALRGQAEQPARAAAQVKAAEERIRLRNNR
jgi:hypothetical protein